MNWKQKCAINSNAGLEFPLWDSHKGIPMKTLNYVRKEKQWQIYHKFEERNKVSFLKEISGNDGFRILKDLHQFAYKLESKINSKKLDIARIKTLSNVHSIFGKVKL